MWVAVFCGVDEDVWVSVELLSVLHQVKFAIKRSIKTFDTADEARQWLHENDPEDYDNEEVMKVWEYLE